MTHPISVTGLSRGMIGRTVAFDPGKEFAGLIGMHHAKVDAEFRDADLRPDHPALGAQAFSHGHLEIVIAVTV